MTTISWQGTIRGGKVDWRDKQGIAQHIAGLEGKRVLITVEEYSGKRSLSANAFFHGVVCKYISEATGYEIPETKILLKHMFLTKVGKNGRLYVRETHRLNRAEFSDFVEQCVRWAAITLDVVIPNPEACQESYAA